MPTTRGPTQLVPLKTRSASRAEDASQPYSEAPGITRFAPADVDVLFANGIFRHTPKMQCAAVTENGTIVTGGEYNTINVWCGGYNPITMCFSQEEGNADIRSVLVLSAERIVTGSAYGQVFLWRRHEDAAGVAAEKGSKHLKIFVEEKSWELGGLLAALPTTDEFEGFASASAEECYIVNMRAGVVHRRPGTPRADKNTGDDVFSSGNRVVALATSAVGGIDGRPYIATGTLDGFIDLRDGYTGVPIVSMETPIGIVKALAVTPNGKCILSAAEAGAYVEAKTPTPQQRAGSYKAAEAGTPTGTIRAWGPDGVMRRVFHHHTQLAMAIVAMPDNDHALSAAVDIKLFNLHDGAVLRTFQPHTMLVRGIALMPDGHRFVSVSDDGTGCIVWHGL